MPISIKTPALIQSEKQLQPVDLFDIIELKSINEQKIQIRKTSGYKIPTNDLNPVYKAAVALQNLRPNKLGVNIKIQKNIPSFSGLSSQMSNAAGILLTLNKLWKFNLNQKELLKIAKTIDSKMADILKIFLNPKVKKTENVILVRLKHIIIDGNWINAQLKPSQKIETVLFRHFPDLKTVIRYLQVQGAYQAGVSGKGSMLFGFFKKSIDEQGIKKILDKKSDFIWVGKTCNGVVKLIN